MAPTNAPSRLVVHSGGDVVPVSDGAPRISWGLPEEWTHQSGYDLEAKIDDNAPLIVTGSGTAHLYVGWPGPALMSGNRVRWRVRARRGDALSAWSAWAQFEVGLLSEDWRSQWISPRESGESSPGRRAAYRLHVGFDVDAELRSARLYVTALGLYEAFVNGARAGRSELTPGASSYDRTVYAQAFDVLTAVRRGTNTLDLLLSDGWFRGGVGAFREPAGWGEQLAARAELHLVAADGRRQLVLSGPDWSSTRSEILRADLMEGQTTDFTAAESSPEPVTRGPAVTADIAWSPAPPVRQIETRAPLSMHRDPDNAVVIDFGQNASGWIRLGYVGTAGTQTVIDHGEHLDAGGELTLRHLDGVRQGEVRPFVQRDVVIASGAHGELFEPRHTIHGFRYARVRSTDPDVGVTAAEMVVVHTDLQSTGSFRCSNDDLNRLHDAARWSFRGNAVDIPTDCPTRERLGWTGDYQVFAPTAVRLFDVSGFSRKWLRSVRDDQLDDGRIANFSPDGRRIKVNSGHHLERMTGSAGWGDAIVAVPWEMYRAYGDVEVLEENFSAMQKWLHWALEVARTRRHPSRMERHPQPLPHEEFIWDGSFHWGEWLEPKLRTPDGRFIDPVQDDPAAWFTADKGEVGTAFLARSMRTVAAVARVLRRDDDARRYDGIARDVVDAWQREFLDTSGRTASDTQAAYVRALAFDLIPTGLRAAAASRLVELIRAADTHLATGFLSTADLLPVLSDTGYPDVAYEVLLQRTTPSWLGMLDRGATTIWEDWDGVDENGVAHESLNHYSKGAVVRFLHSHVLGLQQDPDSVAWESFTVRPVTGGHLEWADGELVSPQGRIEVRWRRVAEDFQICGQVPPGSRATIVLPSGERVLAGPGAFALRERFATDRLSGPDVAGGKAQR